MKLNSRVFFVIREGQLIAWDYVTNDQYALEIPYIQRLLEYAQDEPSSPFPIDEELQEAGFITDTSQEEEWAWGPTAELYHLSTSQLDQSTAHLTEEEWIKEYIEGCKQTVTNPFPETVIEGTRVDLPEPDSALLTSSLLDCFKRRKTTRHFNGTEITLNQLSTLLFYALGPIHEEWSDLQDNGLGVHGRRKAFPSGGGLHPEEAYIFVQNVADLSPGIYHYNSQEHYLSQLPVTIEENGLITLLMGQYFAKGMAAGILLTARFDKSWWKYPHARSYRVMLLDSGHASQTVLLAATAMHLSTWITGVFQDQAFRELIGLTDRPEHPLFFIGLGHGSGQSVDPKMIEMAQKLK